LEIIWPGGQKDTIVDIKANQSLTVQEGKGITSSAPIVFAKPAATPSPTPQSSPSNR
jgi:enediyne biosynthesis protein E4